MINIRHTGIYVRDINRLTKFYKKVFNMFVVCENQKDSNTLLDELFKQENVEIVTTKLITEQGKEAKTGDMIELVQIINGPDGDCKSGEIYNYGRMHICIGVDDIVATSKKITENGGKLKTSLATHKNGNKYMFAIDPEGNWIELIERRANHDN